MGNSDSDHHDQDGECLEQRLGDVVVGESDPASG